MVLPQEASGVEHAHSCSSLSLVTVFFGSMKVPPHPSDPMSFKVKEDSISET